MAREISADHNQIFLLPPSVEDWVPKDHPVRFIREFVKSLDLKDLGFRIRHKSESGADSYSSEMMLGIWIYGYFNRVYSTRRLEAACRKDMPLIWLTGMHYPDHNSIWRFWYSHQAAIKKVFEMSVLTADELGMVGMVIHATDGTKMQAVSSRRSLWNEKDLKAKRASITASIAVMEDKLNESESTEDAEDKIPGDLQEAKKLQQSIELALSTLARLDETNYHPLEPEAKVMTNGRTTEVSYNAQIAVDGMHQIIVTAEVTNEENDQHLMVPMLEKAEDAMGRKAEETLFDAGYDTGEQIAQAEEEGYSFIVNDAQRTVARNNPLHASHFKYQAKENTLECPQGTFLHFKRDKPNHQRGTVVKLFQCKNKECPLRAQCSRSKGGRTVEVASSREAVDRQSQKRSSRQGKETLKKRAGIVEPIFAFIKSNSGFKRFLFRGLEKVSVQWAMLCAVENLKRILKRTQLQRAAVA